MPKSGAKCPTHSKFPAHKGEQKIDAKAPEHEKLQRNNHHG